MIGVVSMPHRGFAEAADIGHDTDVRALLDIVFLTMLTHRLTELRQAFVFPRGIWSLTVIKRNDEPHDRD